MTQVKWEKMRSLVLELDILMREDGVPHKRLEFIRGFLIYLVTTSKRMTPYIKGLQLTIDGWREVHDKEFYKIRIQPQVRLKVWEWEHENWLEER